MTEDFKYKWMKNKKNLNKLIIISYVLSILLSFPISLSSPYDSFTLLDKEDITGSSSTIDYDFIGVKDYDNVDNGWLIGINDTDDHFLSNYNDVCINATAKHVFVTDQTNGLISFEYDENDLFYFDQGYDDDEYFGCAYGNGIIFAHRTSTIEAWTFSVPAGLAEQDTNDSELAEGGIITADQCNNVFAAQDEIINYWNYSQKNMYMGFPKPLVYQHRYDSRTDEFTGLYCNGTHLFVCGEDAIRVFNYSSYKLVNVSYFMDTDMDYDYKGIFYNNSIIYSIAQKDTDHGCNSTLTAYSYDGWNIAVIDNITMKDVEVKDIYGNLADAGRIIISYRTIDAYYMGDEPYYGYGVMIYDFDGATFTFIEDRQDFYSSLFSPSIITDGNLTFMTKAYYGLDMLSYYHDQHKIYPGLYVAAGSSGIYKYNHTTTELTTEYDTDVLPYYRSICTDANGTIHTGMNNGEIYAYTDTGTSLTQISQDIDLGTGNITSITSYKNRLYAADDKKKAYILLFDITNKGGNYTLLSIFDEGITINHLCIYKTILYAATDTCIRAFDVTNDTFIPVGHYSITNPAWSDKYNTTYANNKIVLAGTDNNLLALNFTKSTNFTYKDHYNITQNNPDNTIHDITMYDDDEIFIAGTSNAYSLLWDGTSLSEITNISSSITSYDNVWTDNTYAFYVGRYDANYNLFMYEYGFVGNPDPPYNASFTYNTITDNLNFSWDRGNGSDREVVIRKNGGYPSSPTDGTIMQNDTIQYYNTTASSWVYYTVWSYNDDNHLYSLTGLDINWGIVQLSCFNESNTSQGIDFDVEISNSDTSQVYTAANCHNIHYIPISEIPYGDDTIFVLKNASYKFRTYYKDISLNSLYNFIFYLPPITTPVEPGSGDDGGNTSDTIICLISIIDQISKPIPNVKVEVKRYIETTDTYNEIGSFYTDGNGQFSVYLVPDTLYYFNCSKDGYTQTGSKFWIPTNLIYTKTFMLELVETYEDNETSYDEEIIFNGCILGNNTLLVNYTDLMGLTINTTIYVFETNTTSNITSLIRTDNRNNSDNFQITISDCNRNYTYRVVMHLNHSFFNYVVDYFIIEYRTTITNESNIENKFDNIFGDNIFGWSSIIGFIILIACIFSFSKRNIGVGLILTGGIMIFISAVIGLAVMDIVLSIVFIICGILVQWRVSRMEAGS